MTAKQFIAEHIGNKKTISADAAEILIKLAWEEAIKSERRHVQRQKEEDLYGPDDGYPDIRRTV